MTKQSTGILESLNKSNRSLLEMQIELLQESTAVLREIAQKTGGNGANIITNNTTSVTNMNNQRNLRDVQEMYT
jgi:hypothetical protein